MRMPTPPRKTFGDLCDYYIANRAPQKRSGEHDESIIRCHLRPEFATIQLSEFSRSVEPVDRFIVRRAHLDVKTVANILTLLITMLNVAKDLGWIERVPRISGPRPHRLHDHRRRARPGCHPRRGAAECALSSQPSGRRSDEPERFPDAISRGLRRARMQRASASKRSCATSSR